LMMWAYASGCERRAEPRLGCNKSASTRKTPGPLPTPTREPLPKEEEQKKKDAATMEMEKHLAELRSKEQVELEKHRLTLEAQRPKQETVS
jgi:hypothetical protein